jgi:hypothetical protein
MRFDARGLGGGQPTIHPGREFFSADARALGGPAVGSMRLSQEALDHVVPISSSRHGF